MHPALTQAIRRRWTARNMYRRPRLWLDGDDLVFSGSNLSAARAKGSDGGVLTIAGTPTRATLNGRSGVVFDASGERLSRTLSVWSGGVIFVFAFVAPYTRSGAAGLAHMGAAAGSNAVTLHPFETNTGNIYAAGNGFSSDPTLDGNFTAVTAGTSHSVAIRLGATNLVRVDGTDVTAGLTSTVAAIPNHASQTWAIGESWDPFTFNGEVFQFVLCNYAPALAEIQRLEGWSHWQYGRQSLLPASHPHKNFPPTLPMGWGANDNGLIVPERRLIVPGWRKAA